MTLHLFRIPLCVSRPLPSLRALTLTKIRELGSLPCLNPSALPKLSYLLISRDWAWPRDRRPQEDCDLEGFKALLLQLDSLVIDNFPLHALVLSDLVRELDLVQSQTLVDLDMGCFWEFLSVTRGSGFQPLRLIHHPGPNSVGYTRTGLQQIIDLLTSGNHQIRSICLIYYPSCFDTTYNGLMPKFQEACQVKGIQLHQETQSHNLMVDLTIASQLWVARTEEQRLEVLSSGQVF